jgi:hypothetical protein
MIEVAQACAEEVDISRTAVLGNMCVSAGANVGQRTVVGHRIRILGKRDRDANAHGTIVSVSYDCPGGQ